MNAEVRLAQVFNLPAPQEELHIVFRDGMAWGWGYTAESAHAAALQRVEILDTEDPPEEEEPTAERFVDELHVMRLLVEHRHALDLLHLLGLT